MRLLLTGFEPFGEFATNPSWDALQRAAELKLFEPEVVLARMPVAYTHVFEAWQVAAACAPDAAISFGVHGGLKGRGARTIYLETTARNRDAASKADNSGVTRSGQAIEPGGSESIAATFPAQALCESLQGAGFEAQLSDDAGAYLCNHLFYRAARVSRFPYGFVHVPPVDNQGGALTLDELARAVGLVANRFAKNVAGAQ